MNKFGKLLAADLNEEIVQTREMGRAERKLLAIQEIRICVPSGTEE